MARETGGQARPYARGGRVQGLRERKKERLRQQILVAFIRQFRKHGLQNTRIGDITGLLEISGPTFFRYFPSKEAALREVILRSFARMNLNSQAKGSENTAASERLERLFQLIARRIQVHRKLWKSIALSSALSPLSSPGIYSLPKTLEEHLRNVLFEGQARGEITCTFSLEDLSEFMWALHMNVIRRWAVRSTEPNDLCVQTRIAVEFFARAVRP